MGKLTLAKIMGADNQPLPISAEMVVHRSSKKSVEQLIDELVSKLDGLQGADISQLRTELAALKATWDAFMTGEDDNNGALDRLKELVAAIEANKDSIEALLTDKVAREAFDELASRVAAVEGKGHEHANLEVLAGLSVNEETRNLVFNGRELNGETGIAIGTSAAEASSFTGRIKIVLEELELEEAE